MRSTSDPTVTIVIATYNRAHLIGGATRSVLHQSYQDFELIVVDDASTDHTEEVVARFNDKRIRYLRHEQNKGVAAARNSGIEIARGKYIAFLDSDCEWLPQKLQRQMDVFGELSTHVGVVYTDLFTVSESGTKRHWHSPRIMPEDGTVYEDMLANRLVGICMPSVVTRRECLAKVGLFDPQFRRLEDGDLYIRLSKHYLFYHIGEPLLIHYGIGKGLSSDDSLLIEAEHRILEKHYTDIAKTTKSLATHKYLIGHLLSHNGNVDQGRRHLIEALRLHPLNIKYLVAVLLSLVGESAYKRAVKLKRMILPLREF